MLVSVWRKKERKKKEGGGERIMPVGRDTREKLNRAPHNVSLCLEKKERKKKEGEKKE